MEDDNTYYQRWYDLTRKRAASMGLDDLRLLISMAEYDQLKATAKVNAARDRMREIKGFKV